MRTLTIPMTALKTAAEIHAEISHTQEVYVI